MFAISPNGRFVTGWIDRQTTLWANGKAEMLTFGTNLTVLRSVTDSGYAGALSNAGAAIYDSHGKKLQQFDKWWAKMYPDVLLPGHVTEVSDLCEFGDNLYCLIRFFDSVAEYHLSALAIAPLKRGRD